jgi:hypothetical protein
MGDVGSEDTELEAGGSTSTSIASGRRKNSEKGVQSGRNIEASRHKLEKFSTKYFSETRGGTVHNKLM